MCSHNHMELKVAEPKFFLWPWLLSQFQPCSKWHPSKQRAFEDIQSGSYLRQWPQPAHTYFGDLICLKKYILILFSQFSGLPGISPGPLKAAAFGGAQIRLRLHCELTACVFKKPRHFFLQSDFSPGAVLGKKHNHFHQLSLILIPYGGSPSPPTLSHRPPRHSFNHPINQAALTKNLLELFALLSRAEAARQRKWTLPTQSSLWPEDPGQLILIWLHLHPACLWAAWSKRSRPYPMTWIHVGKTLFFFNCRRWKPWTRRSYRGS